MSASNFLFASALSDSIWCVASRFSAKIFNSVDGVVTKSRTIQNLLLTSIMEFPISQFHKAIAERLRGQVFDAIHARVDPPFLQIVCFLSVIIQAATGSRDPTHQFSGSAFPKQPGSCLGLCCIRVPTNTHLDKGLPLFQFNPVIRPKQSTNNADTKVRGAPTVFRSVHVATVRSLAVN